MTSKLIFSALLVFFASFVNSQNVDLSLQKDPFFQMQWVLKNPDGPFLQYTKTLLDNKIKYYYLPKSFWEDKESNLDLKEMLREKFIILYRPYAVWAQEVSGIDMVLFLSVAARESAWGTSERTAKSGGELFSVKLKEFQKSIGFKEAIRYSDDSKDELFVKLYFGWKSSTWMSFKLFMLSITQDHYIARLSDRGVGMARNVVKWKQGVYSADGIRNLYPAEVYFQTLCGHESFNWASNCEGYSVNFANMRILLAKNNN